MPNTSAFSSARAAVVALLALTASGLAAPAAQGVFFRVKLDAPAEKAWHLNIGAHIHVDPWSLPGAVWPAGADKDAGKDVLPGSFSPWFDLAAYGGAKLHGRHSRAGGVAEFPSITLQFSTPSEARHAIRIELATAADDAAVVRRLDETFTGNATSFLVSPNLRQDAADLETASQGTARRLAWAREASGGRRSAPEKLMVQTQFWAPQRPELNVREAEVLWLLGFNLVGSHGPESREKFPFIEPGGHHWAEFGPGLSREDVAKQIAEPAKKAKAQPRPTLFNFSDEIACRPPIGTDAKALANFHEWLRKKAIPPTELGAPSLEAVQPIESPAALFERRKANESAANRTFYWTTKFRQESANERLRWFTESFHAQAPLGILTSSLVADHPYFGGSGFGMGMAAENTTWGGFPLSLDWFGMARDKVVDVMAIEDWLGLDYMYGPGSTWEGFQLIGFQAALIRSASGGTMPVMTWITPSDEKNLRLKSASALCQGAKHFFYWTYGPTSTSTENYWSDLRSAYDGVVHITRQLAGAEHIIAGGKPRPGRLAVLYSLSSDLFQPFGYLPMAERRLTYFSLIHDQFAVDFLTESDVESGRLTGYDALYCVDPCVSTAACRKIAGWVRDGGALYGACGAASRNEYGEPHAGLAEVFGIAPEPGISLQKGRFDVRGALNDLPWLDEVKSASGPAFGALGLTARVRATTGKIAGTFKDGSPAIVEHTMGKGSARYVATCPAVSYAKDARFVPDKLKEKWPALQRDFINATARSRGVQPLVTLSQPVVEAGIYDGTDGSALVLANFAYEPIPDLAVRLPLKREPRKVTSMEKGALKFAVEKPTAAESARGFTHAAVFHLPLGWNDIVTVE